MIKLNKPNLDFKTIYEDCTNSYTDSDKRNRFEEIKQDVIDFSIGAELHFSLQTQNLIIKNYMPRDNIVTHKEMAKLYDDKFNDDTRSLKYYKVIRQLSPNNICPICGVNTANNLDHYMPKSKYPLLSITPNNLYPCCNYCNRNKRDHSSSNISFYTYHPYYDIYHEKEWLKCDLKYGDNNEMIFIYSVSEETGFSEVDAERIKNHFIIFELSELYSLQANNEFASKIGYLKELVEERDYDSFDKHLKRMYTSNKKQNKNHFKTAMYKELYLQSNLLYLILEL